MSEVCPRCSSDQTSLLEASYPHSFECSSCGLIFLKAGKTLVDE